MKKNSLDYTMVILTAIVAILAASVSAESAEHTCGAIFSKHHSKVVVIPVQRAQAGVAVDPNMALLMEAEPGQAFVRMPNGEVVKVEASNIRVRQDRAPVPQPVDPAAVQASNLRVRQDRQQQPAQVPLHMPAPPPPSQVPQPTQKSPQKSQSRVFVTDMTQGDSFGNTWQMAAGRRGEIPSTVGGGTSSPDGGGQRPGKQWDGPDLYAPYVPTQRSPRRDNGISGYTDVTGYNDTGRGEGGIPSFIGSSRDEVSGEGRYAEGRYGSQPPVILFQEINSMGLQ